MIRKKVLAYILIPTEGFMKITLHKAYDSVCVQ